MAKFLVIKSGLDCLPRRELRWVSCESVVMCPNIEREIMELYKALEYIENFTGESLTSRISKIENSLLKQNKDQINTFLQNQSIESVLINAGFLLKNISGQINVFIHSVGILLALPKILEDVKDHFIPHPKSVNTVLKNS